MIAGTQALNKKYNQASSSPLLLSGGIKDLPVNDLVKWALSLNHYLNPWVRDLKLLDDSVEDVAKGINDILFEHADASDQICPGHHALLRISIILGWGSDPFQLRRASDQTLVLFSGGLQLRPQLI